MGGAIARGVVTDPLVTSSPATEGVTSGKISGPPGGGVTPIVPVSPQMANQYFVKQSAGNPENLSGLNRYDWFISPDGTHAYTRRDGSSDFSSFRQYAVDPPWSITPGDWTFEISQLIGGSNTRTFEWSRDGNYLLTLDRWFSSNYRLINFDQSASPFDATVLGSTTVGTNIATSSFQVRWRPDGLMVFITNSAQFLTAQTVNVAFDASTLVTSPVATFDFSVDAGIGALNSFCFSADGMVLYGSTSTNFLCSWDLSAPYDISSPSNFATGPSLNLPTTLANPRGALYRWDTGDIFWERDQSTQNVRCWSPATSPNIDEFSFNAETTLSGDAAAILMVDLWIRPGGEDLYLNRERTSGTNVFQWKMSTGHDLSTISFHGADFPIGGSDSPRGIALREDDGLGFFLTWRNPTNPDAIYRWPIPTAWDVTSRVVNDDSRLPFDIGNTPRGQWWKPDGTEIYFLDVNVAAWTVYQYTPVSAWTPAGATQTNTFDISSEVFSATGVCLSNDGAKMYVANLRVDALNGDIFQYNLTTPWDISSAVYSGRSISLPGGTGQDPRGIAMKDDIIYIYYQNNNVVEQFTT